MRERFIWWKMRAGEWLVARRREILFGMLIFLVSSLSFGLGYLANRELTHAPIIIEQCATSTPGA